MAVKHFRPSKNGRFGIEVDSTAFGNPGPISPVAVASSTVVYPLLTPLRKSYVERIGLNIGTLAAGAGTITVQFFVRNSVGAKNNALTAAFDLKTGTTLTVREVAITASDSNRVVQEGDYLAADIVASSTITTQPANLLAVVELLPQE